MRTATIFIIFSIFCSQGIAQITRGVDEVTRYHEDLAAIKKGNQWAFVNKNGLKVIDFRDDLVSTINEHFLDEKGFSSVSPMSTLNVKGDKRIISLGKQQRATRYCTIRGVLSFS